MPTSHIAPGLQTISPYLAVADAKKLIEFVTNVFGATECEMMTDDEGTIRHAEYRIGDSVIMVGQVRDASVATPCALYVYVPDVDAAYARALNAGATKISEPVDQPYGDRQGGVKDSNGNTWWIATHIGAAGGK